ncbi:MAG: hypothetical protein B7Z37_14130 [Verrucomicrobia bacterium 12-59-8]|nr:MAG: hypothetical protein B7Z37_14130 [Verrucomicrobia bacterium 12-59-8]
MTCLLAFGCHAALTAQQLKAPDSLRPGMAPVVAPTVKTQSTEEIDKLADEAQKSLFQSVDKAGGGAAGSNGATERASSNPYPSSSPVRLPAQRMEDPSLRLGAQDCGHGGGFWRLP